MSGKAPRIVGFCAEGLSHVRTLMAPISTLIRQGAHAHVLAPASLREEVERRGAAFVDLYAGRPLAELDDSIPIPCRNVTFAGVHAEALAAEVGELEPDLILYETYCVVGAVVARLLERPAVNVSPNHHLAPTLDVAARLANRQVRVSERCEEAARRLRDTHGIAEASPFYYMSARSEHLNLYPEPEEYLPETDRPPFEPLAFFGCLDPAAHHRPREPRADGTPLRVLVSLGTILWRYFEDEAIEALSAIATGIGEMDGVRATISLGNHPLAREARESIAVPGVEVVDYADQWRELPRTDVLVTHHGLNSTHEAIYERVPMVSRPFTADQPLLAKRCQELGLAVPLDAGGGTAGPGAIVAALERLAAAREGFEQRLAEGREWELRTIAGREAIAERMLELSGR